MTNQTRIINNMFPDVQGTKTYAGSFRRIQKAYDQFGPDGSDDPGFKKCLFVVVRRENLNDFIPVCIMHDDFGWAMTGLIALNICVTK